MMQIGRSRYFFWLTRELLKKYTKSLLLGLFFGLIASIVLWYFRPTIVDLWFTPVDRIALIGEFTPSTLPLSVQEKISVGLTTLSREGIPEPGLATRWESTDSGRIYIFHLATDKMWHDKTAVEAQDVNYNIRNVTFSVLDSHTVKAVLTDPFAPFPTLVSKPILSRGLQGFGDYRVVSLKLQGDKVQYMKLVPVVPGGNAIEYRFYKSEAQAFMAFKQGDIDIIEDVTTSESLAGWPNANIETRTRYDQVMSLFFNTKDDLLSEKSIRQALWYAIPPVPGERAFTPLNKESWAYADVGRHYDPSADQVTRLLSASKISSGSAELVITTFPQYVTLAQTIADAWSSAGITTKVKVENVLPASYQVLLSIQTIPPDPDQYPFWHSTQSETNITGYTNVKIDKLLEDGRKELDLDIRKKIYADFQRFLLEDAPAIFLYYPPAYTISRQ